MSARRSSVVRQLCLSASLLALGALVTSCTESAAAAPTAPRSPATTPAMSSSGSYSSSTSGSGAGSGAGSEKNDDEEAALRALTASVNALITRVTALESSTLAARVTALENSTIGTRVSALETKVAGFDLLSARVLKLENVPTTAADLVGTYTGLGTTFDLLSGSGPSVVHAVGSVTLTLASGGAASFSVTGTRKSMRFTSGPFGTQTATNVTETMNGSWSYSGGQLTVFGMPASIMAGGKAIVGSGSTPGDGTSEFYVLLRQ